MTETVKLDGTIEQNLRDAGCSEEFIVRFGMLVGRENKEQLNLLKEHRTLLLDEYHRSQKRIDCLDYLIGKLKKTSEKGKKI